MPDSDYQFWRQSAVSKGFAARGQNVRSVVNALLAGVSAQYVGWWALAWFIAVSIDTYTFRWSAAKVRAIWGGSPKRNEIVGAVMRGAVNILHASLWIAVWAVGGADAGFLAGVMMMISAIPALVYWPNSQPMFFACVVPPVACSLAMLISLHPERILQWMVLPVMVAAGLRIYWLRHDQQSLFDKRHPKPRAA